ncbi:MAG: hypothetical protein K2W95_05435 [Candidatus Obscuribacterales bacterium]|nr:hypothetical protein [Candidatus Obscuribacterales bacterium]
MSEDQAQEKPVVKKQPRTEPVSISLPRFRAALLCFEAAVALILIASILIGQARGVNTVLEAGTVLGLFLVRMALAAAQTKFTGRKWLAILEFFPAIFLPRFGSIDPCAVPMILSTLRLRISPVRHNTAAFIGVFFVVLRETLLCESWSSYAAIASLSLSILLVAIPVILSVQITTALERLAARRVQTTAEHKPVESIPQMTDTNGSTADTVSTCLKRASACLGASEEAGADQDRNSAKAIEYLQKAKYLLEVDLAAELAPEPPPLLLNLPANLLKIDVRISILFTGFYLVHTWIVAGDPARNAALQTILLVASLIAGFLGATGRPPGKEDICYGARILFITLFTIGSFDLINGDLLLFLTAAEIFVLLGTQRGIMPFLLAEVASFVPRGTDQLMAAVASGKLSLSDIGWLYDWNGHATTASIVALLGVGSYAYARMREPSLQAQLESTNASALRVTGEEAALLNSHIERAIELSRTDATAAVDAINRASDIAICPLKKEQS